MIILFTMTIFLRILDKQKCTSLKFFSFRERKFGKIKCEKMVRVIRIFVRGLRSATSRCKNCNSETKQQNMNRHNNSINMILWINESVKL